MRKLLIFGLGQIAELADYYFTRDSDYEVVGFTVDGAFVQEPTFAGHPVVAFEDAVNRFPPDSHELFVAVSYAKLNVLRASKVDEGKEKGYRLAAYLSSRATVFSGFELAENCFILENNTIQPFAKIGRNVTLWSGNHIGHHAVIEDNVFLASHVVVSGSVRIGSASFIGVNATIRDGVQIGSRCVIGAGALVLDHQPDCSVVAPRGTEKSAIPSTRLRNI